MADSDLDPELLAVIVCPDCRSELRLTGGGADGTDDRELECTGCGLVYPIRGGIPVLLVDEARRPS